MAFISIIIEENGNYAGVDISSGVTEKENFHKVYNCGDVTIDFINAIYFAYGHEIVMLLFSSSVDQFVADNCDKYHLLPTIATNIILLFRTNLVTSASLFRLKLKMKTI